MSREGNRLATELSANLIGDTVHIAKVNGIIQLISGDPASVNSVAKTERKLDDSNGALGKLLCVQNQDARKTGITSVGESDEVSVRLSR